MDPVILVLKGSTSTVLVLHYHGYSGLLLLLLTAKRELPTTSAQGKPHPLICDPFMFLLLSSGLCRYRKVAGDKCVPGAERYFFELERQCPVLPPDRLYITYDPKFLHPNINVSFSLIQNEVGGHCQLLQVLSKRYSLLLYTAIRVGRSPRSTFGTSMTLQFQ